MNIADKIKTARTNKGLSQKEIAITIGIVEKTVKLTTTFQSKLTTDFGAN